MEMRLRELLLPTILILSQTACAIPSQDYLECNLPNGDQFILISKYNYSPLGAVLSHIGDVSVREGQGDYEAYFKPKNGKKAKEYIAKIKPGFYGKASLDYDIGKKELCNNFTLVGELYEIQGDLNLLKDGAFIRYKTNLQRQFYIDVQEVARKSNLFTYIPVHDIAFKNSDNLVVEVPLIDNENGELNNSIISVLRVESIDNGRTWSTPIITKDAKLFEIGKSILDQPAVAKPGKWKKGPG